ncbi:spore coat associated protein CotJA [Salipaludibacillus aurantiacus]|uniref:Spore coat protein JA n=1 Tax=Salipaludibacillus aurantiacus TaxID=1601833 RepID=A0A1H9UQ06_9BACI|nr:spore coat associated protein CotJA [Salipaludibacillus aurantiacus]SES11093.1 spore coat protein JA [Salipaludibacillus aurantiacus]
MAKFTLRKQYRPYVSPFDPCPSIRVKTYVTPPNLYVGFQPEKLPQFNAKQALFAGTLWKVFYDPYYGSEEKEKGGGQ